MAMTPYPSANSDYENPSLIASNDGVSWEVPPGLTNPIEDKPVGGNNSDVEIVMSSDGLTLYCYYRSFVSPNLTLYVESSTDGITWGSQTSVLTGDENSLLSPAIIYNSTLSTWQMWCLNKEFYQLEYRTSANPTSGWSSAQICSIPEPTGKDLWHIDVNYDTSSGKYHGFFMYTNEGSNGVGGVLYFAISNDGINWCIGENPLLSAGGTGTWDANRIYRASGIRTATGYDLWYGGVSAANAWRIGKTTVTGI